MKRIITPLITLFITLLISNKANAAPPAKIAIHINTPHKMTMLVNNVNNLRSRFGKEADIVVVVNGPAVIRFSNLSTSRKQLDQILNNEVDVMICSFALKNKNILKDQLLDGTTYLEDGGVAKLVELQQQGYAYLKP